MTSPDRSPYRRLWPAAAVAVCGVVAAAVVVPLILTAPKPELLAQAGKREKAPEFPDKLDWLNTSGPIKLADLKGKVVILDFWTLCCINCIHILPDLAALEKKYPNELVVIGVHSAKFENEKDTKSIRKAVLRYEIAHPVVNDAEHGIWNAYNTQSWPSFAVIDAEGNFAGATSGEGKLEVLDKAVAALIAEAKEKKVLNDKPIRFDLVRFRETADTPLFFPGKVLADEKGKRLAIADSTHHRVVVTDLDGKQLAAIGTGSPGYKNGKFADAQFDDPQGMAIAGDTLYIADRKNHAIRAADLKAGTVKTVAGTGKQEVRFQARLNDTPVAATNPLNSPWDLLLHAGQLFIAMAGHHQIWVLDLTAGTMKPFAGDGSEHITDGPPYAAALAQPSGLATDGKSLFVADSEGSAVRKMPLSGEGRVTTLVGTPNVRSALFNFGDKDGVGEAAKLQHALGVAMHDGSVLIADTYNSKLKVLDPKTREVKTLALKPADPSEKGPLFNEPAGISVTGDTAYVADTNAHRIRVVDLKASTVKTLALTGVAPPPPQKEWLPPDDQKK